MPPRKPKRNVLRSLCADVGPDDGIDPRLSDRDRSSRIGPDHRKRRLCQQVAETLGAVLAGECGDDLLNGLSIVAVEPWPDVARLLITVRVDPPGAVDPGLVLDRLARASGRLRRVVAATITRRKAPSLAFRLAVACG